MDPAHQVIVVGFLPDAREVGGKPTSHGVGPLAHRVAGEASPTLKALLTFQRIARCLVRERGVNGVLPDESRDGLDLVVVETESRHARCGPKRVRIFNPYGDPLRT